MATKEQIPKSVKFLFGGSAGYVLLEISREKSRDGVCGMVKVCLDGECDFTTRLLQHLSWDFYKVVQRKQNPSVQVRFQNIVIICQSYFF